MDNICANKIIRLRTNHNFFVSFSFFIPAEFAWVTLATNDSYALGALVVANSLKKVNTVHQLAVLVTPGVTPSMRERLQTVYNVVEQVNVLDSKDVANLALLSRPELGITFTKLHCWRLTQFEKCVFLDADTFVSHSQKPNHVGMRMPNANRPKNKKKKKMLKIIFLFNS